MNDDLLDEAIDHARDVAHTSSDASCAEEHDRLATWLTELKDRRQHTPLRCRLGLHKNTLLPGTAGRRCRCVLCGKTGIDYTSP
jgi:hypothetical protein